MIELTTTDLFVRVLVAAGLGGLVGLEREFSDQPAGFRTHILVSIGAALFTLVGAGALAHFDGGDPVRFDPTRVAAQVVTGIGFLGAGAIIQQGVNVRGLTTAASLWVTAAIGTAVGLGFLTGGAIATAVTLVALVALKQVERWLISRLKRGHFRMVVDGTEDFRIVALIAALDAYKGRIHSIKHIEEEEQGHRFVVRGQVASADLVDRLLEDVRDLPGVRNVDRSV
ncbi:MAG TPA: MgtC/SapB family protein [Actinomycetota bacterium]|nr:MgtC/SapB family protein [Actinomycetota bacterium]